MKYNSMTPEQCNKFDRDISTAIFLRSEKKKFDPAYVADMEEKLYYFRCNYISKESETANDEKVTDYVIELHGVKYVGIEVCVIKEETICDGDLDEVYILTELTVEDKINELENELIGLNLRKESIESELANLKVQNAYQAISKLD